MICDRKEAGGASLHAARGRVGECARHGPFPGLISSPRVTFAESRSPVLLKMLATKLSSIHGSRPPIQRVFCDLQGGRASPSSRRAQLPREARGGPHRGAHKALKCNRAPPARPRRGDSQRYAFAPGSRFALPDGRARDTREARQRCARNQESKANPAAHRKLALPPSRAGRACCAANRSPLALPSKRSRVEISRRPSDTTKRNRS